METELWVMETWNQNKPLSHGFHHFWVMGDGNKVMSYGNMKSKHSLSFSTIFFWFSQVLSSCEVKTVHLKRTTIQSKFKDKLKQQGLTIYCLLSSSSSLYTNFFLLSFPPKPPICTMIQLLHNPASASISLY